MSCNALCPNGANPYGLLLERYHERYLESGIPRIFCNAMPQRNGPNIWRGIDRWLSEPEKSHLALWAQPPGREEVLFLGCNQRLTPYVADTALFDGLAIFSDPGECCGEYYLRLGLIREARNKAASLSRRFDELGIRKVIAFCPACQNTMLNLAPGALGVGFNVEITGLVDWIAAGISRGDIAPIRRLKGTVTVQDPCHASGLGRETIEAVRVLLRDLGLTVIEMEHSGLEAECCGLGASLARYRISDMVRTGIRRSRQARRTGASLTCAWCNGCYMVMNMLRLVYPAQPPVFHLLELLQLATGEEPRRKLPARSMQLVASAVEAAARDGFRFGRTHRLL
jgi:Fe-S oxidoreductase